MLDRQVYTTPDVLELVYEVTGHFSVTPTPRGPHLGRETRNYVFSLGSGAYLEIEIIGPDPEQPNPLSDSQLESLEVDRRSARTWAYKSVAPGVIRAPDTSFRGLVLHASMIVG